MAPDKPQTRCSTAKDEPSTPSLVATHDGPWNVRHFARDDPEYDAAVHLAVVGSAPPSGGSRHPAVAELLSDATEGPLRIELVHGACRNNDLISAVLAVESPGGSGLVLLPPFHQQNDRLFGTGLALRELASAAWSRSYGLLEVLLPPELTNLGSVLRAAGFRFLTNLVYLLRPIERRTGPEAIPPTAEELTWATYSDSTEPLFCEAVRQSYVQSSDCPELTEIRTPKQALASHRAAGVHHPDLWFVALRANDPVGVLLLSRMRRQPSVEIVYMGVVQPARGTGVGDALMVRAVEAARSVSATSLALAADARNAPARRFYERWDFAEAGLRCAWIATPRGIETCGPECGFQR